MRYQVRILSILLLFKEGTVVLQRTGVMDKGEIQKLLDPHL